MSVNILSTILTVIRKINQNAQVRTLYLPFYDPPGSTVANDRAGFGEEYDAPYVGGRNVNTQLWTGESVVIDGDYFQLPAAPINDSKDFTFMCWVKTESPNFTLLSCKRNTAAVLEINNKKVTVNGQEFTYA